MRGKAEARLAETKDLQNEMLGLVKGFKIDGIEHGGIFMRASDG